MRDSDFLLEHSITSQKRLDNGIFVDIEW